MKKKLNRLPKKDIFFKIKNKVVCKKQASFCKKNKIHRVIKLHPYDFDSIKKNSKKITHFNIKNTNSKPGKYYFMIKILKACFFDGRKSIEPILLFNNFLLVKCTSVKNNIRYEKVDKRYFKNSVGNIKNIKNLKKTIKRRYKKTLSHLTDFEKLALGVGISEFNVERHRIPSNKYVW